jgi:hypothetical protein
MQVLYERCAAVDVSKNVIAVAVRLPGDGPDGRQTVKRTFKTFYGVLGEAARWLASLDVTHVAMEATGIFPCPSTTRCSSTGSPGRCWSATPGTSRTSRAVKQTGRRGVAGASAGVRAAEGELHP